MELSLGNKNTCFPQDNKHLIVQNRQSLLAYNCDGVASCNVKCEGKVLLFCFFVGLFVFSPSKKTSLAWKRDLLFFADEIKGDVCEWRNMLSDCSIASQSNFAWINILGSQHLSVPYSACFIHHN